MMNQSEEIMALLFKLLKFRGLSVSLIIALIIFFLVIPLTGENGIISDFDQLFPTALGMLFVAWSIVQGSSFTKWASSNSARNFQNRKATIQLQPIYTGYHGSNWSFEFNYQHFVLTNLTILPNL